MPPALSKSTLPAIDTRPLSGRPIPATILRVWVLPAPDGPSSATWRASLAIRALTTKRLSTCRSTLWMSMSHVMTPLQLRTATRPGTSRPAASSTQMQVMEVTATRKFAWASCPACTAS